MAFHSKPLEHFLVRHSVGATTTFFVLVLVTAVAVLLTIIIWKVCALDNARIKSKLIHQMECTQQAERKSMNKSAAISKASHDIRGLLGCLITYIDMSYNLVPSESKVEDNLRSMHKCADSLMGLVNNLLDKSKVEAGKVELEDKEFNLLELVETVADFYHPTAMKKGVEVVLDLCDGSLFKFANVRGDALRLYQIISNLVNNAVKFTSKGSVSLRARARKPSPLDTSILVGHQNSWLDWFSRILFKDVNCDNGVENNKKPQKNPNNCMEYIIEVDDTGVGIPKDKHKSVFEDYVQVRENSAGHSGTGLGLGIVQSLVRLMGGEIGIVDKEHGKEGTIFKFNIFLTACNQNPDGRVEEADIEAPAQSSSEMTSVLYDVPIHQKVDGSSLVVLLIHNNERRRVVKRYLERLDIKVSMVKHWEYLQGHLRRIKSTLITQTQNNASNKSDWSSSQSDYMSGRSPSRKYAKEFPLSSLDGMDHVFPGACARRGNKGEPTFVLFIIDANAGPFEEMATVVEDFRTELSYNNVNSMAIWLENPAQVCNGLSDILRPNDAIISKPLHGSRLNQVAKILPEFGGISTLRNYNSRNKQILPNGKLQLTEDSEIKEKDSSGSEEIISIRERLARVDRIVVSQKGFSNGEMLQPLSGLRILVAEDTEMLATLADKLLTMLGANVHIVENGKQALNVVLQGLNTDPQLLPEGPSSKTLPFDLILMDCEMPVMNGFEATREIRKAEKPYGVHIPIVALTAHIAPEMVKETELAGMDEYLSKPILKDTLVQTITHVVAAFSKA